MENTVGFLFYQPILFIQQSSISKVKIILPTCKLRVALVKEKYLLEKVGEASILCFEGYTQKKQLNITCFIVPLWQTLEDNFFLPHWTNNICFLEM